MIFYLSTYQCNLYLFLSFFRIIFISVVNDFLLVLIVVLILTSTFITISKVSLFLSFLIFLCSFLYFWFHITSSADAFRISSFVINFRNLLPLSGRSLLVPNSLPFIIYDFFICFHFISAHKKHYDLLHSPFWVTFLIKVIHLDLIRAQELTHTIRKSPKRFQCESWLTMYIIIRSVVES